MTKAQKQERNTIPSTTLTINPVRKRRLSP
jgi:hypothetical protein